MVAIMLSDFYYHLNTQNIPALVPTAAINFNIKYKETVLENLKGRDHLEYLGVDEKIILEWILGE
jgi:hypothetical protein